MRLRLLAAALMLCTAGIASPSFAQENPDDGGPDFYQVQGVGSRDMLNIRAKPSSSAAILTAVPDGTFLRNRGCAFYKGSRWCHVSERQDGGVTGWAYGKYLREGYPPQE